MDLTELFTEDRAVSPVIGVILMVAITVILAAVIGAFVLGLGDSVSETSPNAQVSFDFNGTDDFSMTHEGGDSFEGERVNVTGPIDYDEFSDGIPGWESGTISAGNTSGTVDLQDDTESGATIRLVWTGSGGSSSTIARGTV